MAVSRFNNPLRQRLIAAGAQPARADAFVQQKAFESGAPVGMPSVAGKPMGPNEWYNEDYQTASQSLYSKGFKPPTPDSADFATYYDIVFGKGAYQKVFDKELRTESPTYRTASLSAAQLDKDVVKMINQGYSMEKISEYLRSQGAKDAGSLMGYTDAGGQKNIISSLSPDQAIFRATEIYSDYLEGKDKINDKLIAAAKANKDYKFGMPDPKLRYGMTTDLKKGTVDVLTNPTAAKAYAAYVDSLKGDRMAAQKASSYLMALVNEVNKRQITPWKDEAKRRDYLKGKKIGG